MIPIAKPIITAEEINNVKEVLKSGNLVQGERVKKFEEEFAKYIGTKYAIATNSGTTALHLALLSAGIREGDEVITTPFSFIATANSILYCKAKPVFADIDPETFNLDPNKICEKITSKTKAILLVHLYGQPCNMRAFQKICRKYKLILIEDACQAHGAEYYGKKVGSFGIGVFSFYPSKNMTTGEGGMITTNNKRIAELARMMRDHGQKKKYFHEILGYNYRMTEIAASIGLTQLKKLDKFNQKRIENATFFTSELKNVKEIVPPVIKPHVKHVFNVYTIRVSNKKRNKLFYKLNSKGVQARIFYPLPIHQQPFYKRLFPSEKLPEAEKASKTVLSLPVHPSLTRLDLNKIIALVKESLR